MQFKTHNLSSHKEKIDNFSSYIKGQEFKRASGFGRRTGNSMERENLSEYEYINTRSVFKNSLLKKELHTLTDDLNLTPHLLVNYILRFQRGDFLDWMDYFMWQQSKAVIGKFFSIALEKDGVVGFKEIQAYVPRYHAIEFSPKTIHRVDKVKSRQTWLVLMVSSHLVLKDIIN
jgi:hypothetical protein